jgi:hypothetical protein
MCSYCQPVRVRRSPGQATDREHPTPRDDCEEFHGSSGYTVVWGGGYGANCWAYGRPRYTQRRRTTQRSRTLVVTARRLLASRKAETASDSSASCARYQRRLPTKLPLSAPPIRRVTSVEPNIGDIARYVAALAHQRLAGLRAGRIDRADPVFVAVAAPATAILGASRPTTLTVIASAQ